jgi:hypothetical protein
MGPSLKNATWPKRDARYRDVGSGRERMPGHDRKPFFGALQPVAGPGLLLLLGLASITTFYGSVLTAAHAIGTARGSSPGQLGSIMTWVCALFLAQGLVPLVKFGFRDMPKLIANGIRMNIRDWILFVVLLVAAGFLFL